MPRKEIELDCHLSYLSILDEQGAVDASLEPSLDDALLLRMHRAMLLSRRFDERMLVLQREGRLGTFAPVKGQEAAQIGAMAALDPQDWFLPSFRETAAAIWRETPLVDLLLYTAGFNEGGAIAPEANDFPIAIPVATQIPHAVGIAFAIKYRKEKQVAITFFGDGATSEGDFHEALNFAGVFQVPAIFLCQNNHWAISLPREKQTRSTTLAQKAIAYGIPGIQVDGNDVLAVYSAVHEAAERGRAGEGSTLIECVTYRMSVHTTADDPTRYRDKAELEAWAKRDPIKRLQAYLGGKNLLSDEDIERVEKAVHEEVETAWSEAQATMEELNDPSVIFDHLYAETPPYLSEQRQALQALLQREGEQ